MAQMSEFLQQSWPKVFGADRFELKLQAMPANQLSQVKRGWKTNPASYELSWGGWVGNDLSPWNSFKYWTSYYSNKNEPYLNEEFDKVFNEANFGENRFDDGSPCERCCRNGALISRTGNRCSGNTGYL